MINYYDVMKTGYAETKDQVESVFHMAGIVDTVVRLSKLFEKTETEEDN